MNEDEMKEDEMKEAKIITLAIAKLREFCQGIENCDECPLCVDKKFVSCFFTDATPNSWDADEALYRMAFNDGRREV